MSGAVDFISKPFMAIPEDKRKALGLILVAIILLLFPLLHDNDADIDTAANALSYATLALGLKIFRPSVSTSTTRSRTTVTS